MGPYTPAMLSDWGYTGNVARGWESKSVEEQIEAARTRHGESKARLTPEELEIVRKRDSLLLQRTRVKRELENCGDERYRKTLSEGLAYLEAQLSALGWKNELGAPGLTPGTESV